MNDSHATASQDSRDPVVEMPESPVSWTELFGNHHPVVLEIGSGKGLFLVNSSRKNPHLNYLGVEIAKKYAYKAVERIKKAGLPNALMLPGDARQFLHLFVPERSVDELHIYFPDPWWKKRHRKRRVFCEEFVADVARILIPGGEFLIATDVEEYFQVMMDLMKAHSEFAEQPRPEPTMPEHDLDYLTNFERKYRIEGRPIHRAHYRLSGDASNPSGA